MCSHLFAIEQSNCGCDSDLNIFDKKCYKQYYESVETEMHKCILNYLKQFRNELKYTSKCDQYCPLECESISFSVTPFFEPMPTSGLISSLSKSDYYLDRFNTYEEANKHYISIFIYYKELKYTLISQEPKLEIFVFVSNIGGILGLFLGISFLSFVEIFEILFEIIFIILFE